MPAANSSKTLPASAITALIALASLGYGLAFSIPAGAPAILPALACICMLARVGTPRRAFYSGLVAGVVIYAPHLWFFFTIFGWPAILLWLITGWPIGAFVLLLHLARRRLKDHWVCFLTPFLWTGIEFFRSELYPLRFAWLLPGQAGALLPGVGIVARLGVYGVGFAYVALAAMLVAPYKRLRMAGVLLMVLFAASMYLETMPSENPGPLRVAGIQLEHPSEKEAADALDRLAIAHPEAAILVMSEYTFDGPVPESVRAIVRKHQRYLIAGGKKFLADDQFYDTAFVIGPDGQEVFEQGKSVPVQLMDDGLPAPSRRVWESPWGKIGISICYDVSYALVMDDFIRQGAQGLILPTMDLTSWGLYERRMLHGRLAPIRSAEYGVPVFSVWSSGESQLTDRIGRVIATAGYPGQGEMIAGSFDLAPSGHVPPDRVLAWVATAVTGLFVFYLIAIKSREILTRRGSTAVDR